MIAVAILMGLLASPSCDLQRLNLLSDGPTSSQVTIAELDVVVCSWRTSADPDPAVAEALRSGACLQRQVDGLNLSIATCATSAPIDPNVQSRIFFGPGATPWSYHG